ncbi:MAG: hypothetical protein QOJ51_2823 [Acidobacteriaceae bacterium]|nr:hypothetical protein [Acidobacteriaceae bacterium]
MVAKSAEYRSLKYRTAYEPICEWLTILVSSVFSFRWLLLASRRADVSWLELSEGHFIVDQILKYGRDF